MSGPILIDTSVWINHFKNIESKSCLLLRRYLLEDGQICYCPPVLQELLQRFKNKNQRDFVRDDFNNLIRLDCGHYAASDGAAEMYFNLRKKGLTIRKPNDCLTAWYAIENNLTLAHDNVDFERIKELYPLKTIH